MHGRRRAGFRLGATTAGWQWANPVLTENCVLVRAVDVAAEGAYAIPKISSPNWASPYPTRRSDSGVGRSSCLRPPPPVPTGTTGRHVAPGRTLREHSRAPSTISGGPSIKTATSSTSSLQPRRDRPAAERFFRELLKGHCCAPRRLITDRLRSYSAAHAIMLPSVVHSTQQYENNRAEVSHQPTRQRERQMRRFESAAKRNGSYRCTDSFGISFAWGVTCYGLSTSDVENPSLPCVARRDVRLLNRTNVPHRRVVNPIWSTLYPHQLDSTLKTVDNAGSAARGALGQKSTDPFHRILALSTGAWSNRRRSLPGFDRPVRMRGSRRLNREL